MFLSNNSCSSRSNITDQLQQQQQQQQQPMFDRPLFLINDVNPNNFKHHHHQPPPPPPPFHELSASFFHFSPTFIDEDDVGFLQQHQELELLLSTGISQFTQQQPLLVPPHIDTTTTTTTTTTTCSQSTLPAEAALHNIDVVPSKKDNNNSKMINKNIIGIIGGGNHVTEHFKTNNKKCRSSDLMITHGKINTCSWNNNNNNNKRCSKKDRHSKIVTAQGLRDRRMRLSLKVARPFFSLQDMLGFDKASKTVEWLLMNCKQEINELKRSKHLSTTKRSCSGDSYTSECEVVSEIDIISNNTTQVDDHQQGNIGKKEKRVRRSRKPPTFHPLAKESRAKARARARERTIGKIWNRSIPTMQYHPQGNNDYLHNNLNQLRSSTCSFEFEAADESGSQSHDMKSSLEVVAEVEEPSSHSLEESIVITSNSSVSHQIFNYHQEIRTSQGLNLNNNNNNNNNNSSSFAENWDIDDASPNSSFCATSTGNVNDPISSPFSLTTSDARLPSQFIDFQFFDKPWQTYNNESP